MPKALRFQAMYDFKVMYIPPDDIPVLDFFKRPGGDNLPCFTDGNLSLRLHEGTSVEEAEDLAAKLNKFVHVVAYTVPPTGQEAILEDDSGVDLH